MKKLQIILALTSVVSILLFSCKKENDATTLTYQLKKTPATSSLISGRGVMGGSVQWTSGYASIVEIEFEAEKENLEVEYRSDVRQKVDLFSPLSSLGVINVPPGIYDEIEFQVEVQPNGGDAAFQLSGSFTNGRSVTTPIIFTLNTPLEIESEQSNITIVDGASITAFTTLNLSLLTTGVTESMLNNATRTAGIIQISATSNTNIYNIIFENLKECSGVEIDD